MRTAAIADRAGAPMWPAALVPYLASLPARPILLRRQPAGPTTEIQTSRTIADMTAHVYGPDGASSLAVRLAVADAIRPLIGRPSTAATAAAIFWWVKSHVRFRDDPDLDELLLEPALLLAMPIPEGDCDDFSMLTAAMLEAANVPWEFYTIAADQRTPGRFSHVYVRALVEER